MQNSSLKIDKQAIRAKKDKRLSLVIVTGFVVVILLIVMSFSFSYHKLSDVETRVSETIEKNNQKTELINHLNEIARERLVILHQMSNETDVFRNNEIVKEYYRLGEQFIIKKQHLESLAFTKEEIDLFTELELVVKKIYPIQVNIVDRLRIGEYAAADKLLPGMEVLQDSLGRILGRYSSLEERFREESLNKIQRVFDKSLQTMQMLSFTIIFFIGLVAYIVIHTVNKQQKSLIDLNNQFESYNTVLELNTLDAIRSNKTKSEFIANMSHELRTPMTAIKGSLGILNSHMIEDIPAEAQELISMADKNTDLLISLVTDVLDFSKLEANEIDIIKQDFLIHSEIEKFLIPFYKQARSKSIGLKVSLSTQLPQKVRLDQTHLFQILAQLISNAIKFTNEGEVMMKIEYIAENKNIIFHIIDTGIGLEEKDIHFLFESFVQGDGSSTRKYGGTGIGLAICRKLIDALEGNINVISKKDEGSTFTLSIPIDIEDIAA